MELPEAANIPRTGRFRIWLVVTGTMEFHDFPYIGKFIIPTEKVIFFRGVGQPPTRYGYYGKFLWHSNQIPNDIQISRPWRQTKGGVPRQVSCTVAWWQVTSNGMGTKLEINGFGTTMDMGVFENGLFPQVAFLTGNIFINQWRGYHIFRQPHINGIYNQ